MEHYFSLVLAWKDLVRGGDLLPWLYDPDMFVLCLCCECIRHTSFSVACDAMIELEFK